MTHATTLSPPGRAQTPLTTVTTNAQFLAAIFVELKPTECPVVLRIDGVINDKTTWGAGAGWTPTAKVDDVGTNWFFTLSTYTATDGSFRRRKASFHRAFGIYLDDVGTKAAPRDRLDVCPPSYLLETSSGNYQAGYLFDQPCDEPARVEALQESLIRAGLCDPGANGPSARLGRMPFAINGKYDPPHECRLVEWHPERRYRIEQIVERLELEPTAPAGCRRKVKTNAQRGEEDIYRPRATENAVLAGLRQRGLYKRPLGNGAHDITCPWVSEHTDGIDHGTAYFEPNDLYPVGGFKCQHGHGQQYRIKALLDCLGVTFAEAKHKPTIRVAAGELHRVVDAAEQELAAGGRHYQRGGLIVTVQTDTGTTDPTIKPVSANALTRALSACVTWERFDARISDYVQTDPPAKHVNVLFDADHYRHLPVLRGIARQPYLRRDGTLMMQAGFDAMSGMFGAFEERTFQVPVTPDKAMAAAALIKLRSLLEEFSFAHAHDEAAALALILTATIRPALAVAPMGHIKAPQIASGKSYLSSLIAAFSGPARSSAYSFPSSEEECSKLLLSALLAAPPVVVFDNLTTDLIPFKSLCSALTEEHLTGRILGVSKTATVPTQVLFLSSGNNVDAVRDMTRRVVTITLDPKVETPATRKFSGDPVRTVHHEREKFVSLALTVVRGYLAAGEPDQGLKPLGSYGDWSRLVRAPLVWLGLPDPATAIFNCMAQDPDRETLGRMLEAWHKAFGTAATSVRDVVDRVEMQSDIELGEAVREVADERGVVNRRRLGRWIARHQGRLVNGKRVERDTRIGGSERWHLVVMGVPVVTASDAEKTVTPEEAF